MVPLLLFFLAVPQDALKEEVDGVVRRAMGSGKHVGIVVGVLKGDTPAVFGYGRTSGDLEKAPSGETLFEIGSITKAFTGILLAGMSNEGLVALEDPVRKHLPDGAAVPSRGGKEITLLHLATHTSGLPRMPGNFRPKDRLNPYADYEVKDLFEFLSRLELPRDPGGPYEYSNLGTALLGHALARRAGKGYEELVAERICGPLGMKATRITLTDDLKRRLAPPHRPDGKPVKNWDLPTFAGAGALRSTADDMLRFLAANLGGAPKELAAAIVTSHAPRTAKMGLGWHFAPTAGARTMIWHNGGTGGYASFAGLVKDKRVAVVVLSNSAEGVDEIGVKTLEALDRATK